MPKTVIKICDVRTVEDAVTCKSAGVDMIGVHCIWAPPSPERRQEVLKIREALEGKCDMVLVTRQNDISCIREMVSVSPWDYIQLHAPWDWAEIVDLRAALAGHRHVPRLIGVVSAAESRHERVPELERVVDALLIDSSMRGGTGVRVASTRLKELITMIASKPVIIAGGLHPDNVVEIVREFRPWGVDVQSGVGLSGRTGRKDPRLIEQFVRNIRAFEELETDASW